MRLTAHCLVKNEENFIGHAVRSVVDFVEKVIIFDTGSTDGTVRIIKDLCVRYPDKIIFEEKGESDKKRHTKLRQEMIDRTETDWFMILDGDEVWTVRGMQEAIQMINENQNVECILAPFYLCVGDVYHQYAKKGAITMLGITDFFYPRFVKVAGGVRWQGDYNQDTLVNSKGEVFFNSRNTLILKNRYWHLTHLKRSSKDDNDYSSYGSRKEKLRETYFIIGKKITEPAPEVFTDYQGISFLKSFYNFWALVGMKILQFVNNKK